MKRLVMMKTHVNKKFSNTCSPETVRIAYNNDGDVFRVDANEDIVRFPYPGSLSDIRPGEILSSFMANKNLLPVWTNCNGSWGSFENGSWNGAVAEVNTFVYHLISTQHLITRLVMIELTLVLPILHAHMREVL